MADIAAAIAKHGNIWSLQTNADMEAIFEPLHEARAASFKDCVKVEKSLKYGLSERHRIDVYSPTSSFGNASASRPVVVFFHGGGFIAGDNDITPSMHAHIGNFFASNGCICALATYRVIPEAVYPSGANDISQAIKWAKDNADKYGGNPSNITAVGQSAGGAHLASAIFNGKLKALGIDLHGAILLSAPLWYDLRQERRKKNMQAYHASQSDEEILKKTGVAQFQNSKPEDISPTNILLMLGQFDPNEIVDGNFMFVAEYRKKFAKLPVIEVMKGQNHISYFLGLGLEDDKLGRRILDFMEASPNKR